jgi:phosphate transport system protein
MADEKQGNRTPGGTSTRHSLAVELHRLNTELAHMGELCAEMLDRAMEALDQQNFLQADEVIRLDDEVDRLALDIQRRSITLIALQHPVASDVRAVVLLLRALADLERVGDYAAEIAGYARTLGPFRPAPIPEPLRVLGETVAGMIRDTVDAFVERNLETVDQVCRVEGPAADAAYRQVLEEATERMKRRPEELEIGLYQVLAARALERIGGHCTNVAEWTQYLVSGVYKQLA